MHLWLHSPNLTRPDQTGDRASPTPLMLQQKGQGAEKRCLRAHFNISSKTTGQFEYRKAHLVFTMFIMATANLGQLTFFV